MTSPVVCATEEERTSNQCSVLNFVGDTPEKYRGIQVKKVLRKGKGNGRGRCASGGKVRGIGIEHEHQTGVGWNGGFVKRDNDVNSTTLGASLGKYTDVIPFPSVSLPRPIIIIHHGCIVNPLTSRAKLDQAASPFACLLLRANLFLFFLRESRFVSVSYLYSISLDVFL